MTNCKSEQKSPVVCPEIPNFGDNFGQTKQQLVFKVNSCGRENQNSRLKESKLSCSLLLPRNVQSFMVTLCFTDSARNKLSLLSGGRLSVNP